MNFHLVCIWPVKQIKSSCFLSRLNWLKEEKGEIPSVSLLSYWWFLFPSFAIRMWMSWIVTKHDTCALPVYSVELFMLLLLMLAQRFSRERVFFYSCAMQTPFSHLLWTGRYMLFFWLIFPDNTNVASDAHKLFALTEVVLHFHLYTSISVDKCVQISG